MLDEEAQKALDDALDTGAATYEISRGRNALILSVRNEHYLIPYLEKIFDIADLDLFHKEPRHPDNAVPILRIGKYAVSPKFERKKIEGYYKYELIYSKQTES